MLRWSKRSQFSYWMAPEAALLSRNLPKLREIKSVSIDFKSNLDVFIFNSGDVFARDTSSKILIPAPFWQSAPLRSFEKPFVRQVFRWLFDLRSLSVTFVLYIGDSFWSGDIKVEDFDFRRGIDGFRDESFWLTEPEDFVLVSVWEIHEDLSLMVSFWWEMEWGYWERIRDCKSKFRFRFCFVEW